MIKKILNITGIGRFADYHLRTGNNWDGSFSEINVIYAPNGSGKTTLSTIFKSLAQLDSTYIQLKKTFDTVSPQAVKIVTNPSGILELKDNIWSDHSLKIEVLDILFIEDYLFSGSILITKNKLNLFKLLSGDKGIVLSDRYRICKNNLNRFQNRIKAARKSIREDIPPDLTVGLQHAKDELKNIELQIEEIAATTFAKYVEAANGYLLKFAPYIRFDSFQFEPTNDNSKKLRLKLVIDVQGQKIQFVTPAPHLQTPTVKFTLSEGDKSAVALCFFLARLDILGYNDKIIVFDDPLSSFDYGRKLTTINTLAKIAVNCKQFFLLTHDLYFAKDFSDKLEFKGVTNVKIENNGTTSLITTHDISLDTLSSIQKDFQTIAKYLTMDASSDIERREVARCIRPILEGVIRSKYFEIIEPTEWLGDAISKIRNSTSESRLFKLKAILDDIIELNDFSKGFHHSNDRGQAETINPFELKKYITLLMATVDKI